MSPTDFLPQVSVSVPRLIAAPFTAFDAEGRVRLERVEEQAEGLRRSGVSGVFVCGTTGEGMSLPVADRRALAEAWRRAAGKELHLTVHVGHASVGESRDLASHAASIGADAIASLGPCFFSAETVETLTGYCARIAASAPGVPFYYYHMPSMVRVGVKASEALEAMRERIPTFAGVKFTHEDLADYRRCLELAGDRYEIFFGRDELLLEGLRRGARSAVGSTYNFAAPLYLEMARALAEGGEERAEALQALCTRAIGVMVRAGGLPAIKATMGLCGFDCGPVLLPLRTLDGEAVAELRRNLEGIGFFAALREASENLAVLA